MTIETFDPDDIADEIVAVVTGSDVTFRSDMPNSAATGGGLNARETTTSSSHASPENVPDENGPSDARSESTPLSADEVYCRSCGVAIKQRAEICPSCGVRNAAQTMPSQRRSRQAGQGPNGQSNQGGTNRPTSSTDRESAIERSGISESVSGVSQGTSTEPSAKWKTGVAVGTGLWTLVCLALIPLAFLIQDGSTVGSTQAFQTLGLGLAVSSLQLLGWVVLPLSLYYDQQYVNYHVDDWPLNDSLYVGLAAFLPIFTQILGGAAFFTGSTPGFVGVIVPLILIGLGVRYLRTRSRVLNE